MNKMRKHIIKKRKKMAAGIVSLGLALALTACAGSAQTGSTTATTTVTQNNSASQTTEATATITQADPEASHEAVTGDFSLTDESGNTITGENGVYTITKAGVYTATGVLSEGQILIAASETDEVELVLSGVDLTCSTAAPIAVTSAASVEISAKKDTYNQVTDKRESVEDDEDKTEDTEASDANGNAAIYATCDLKIKGKGTLVVTAENTNGIKSKDDLKIQSLTLKVTAYDNALKGNDAVKIESGSLILISKAKDGIKTSNSEVTSKGKQKGCVTISGGQIDIYAACDGIDAAADVSFTVSEDGEAEPVVNIFTASYSEYGESVSGKSEQYFILPKTYYNITDTIYAYFYNESEESGKWVECTYATMIGNGRTASYYGYVYTVPDGYESVAYYIYSEGQTVKGDEYYATSEGETVNTTMNGFLVSSIEDGSMGGDWVNITTSSGNGSSKTTYSSKGIKAGSAVNVDCGTITIKSGDDAIHANTDTLDSKEKGTGNVTISGGSLTITAADDGIHADNALTVNAGSVRVENSHEGLEGNAITINDGTLYVYGSDDGFNATKGSVTPEININGGNVTVVTPSGDTDGIDSNGNINITGGFTLVLGGNASGNVAGSVDTDGKIMVTGGTIVALGGICETPATGSVNTYVSAGTAFSAGSYEITNSKGEVLASFTLNSSYSSIWFSSESLALNESYEVKKDGTTLLSWTQSAATEGSAGNAGMLGPGGGRPGRW